MTDHEKTIIMLMCGALRDLSEKNEKSSRQAAEIEKQLEKLIKNVVVPVAGD